MSLTNLLRLAMCLGLLIMIYNVNADECRNYTPKQQQVLNLAYTLGAEQDLGLTLAAIVKQESFVGNYIIRENPNDYSTHFDSEGRENVIRGSYGVTMVLLSTAMWIESERSVWAARANIAHKLINDDHYAMMLALRKMTSVKKEGQTWREWVARYNGAGIMADEYAEKVAGHVLMFNDCGTFIKLQGDSKFSLW